jgi:cell division protein FtsL
MASMPAYLNRTAPAGNGGEPPVCRERDPFQLRELPLENVFWHPKKIDNSRLVREPDPRSRGACWSAIGAASVLLVLLTGVLVPNVANTLAGYKLENLKVENRKLQDELRTLDLREAELTSPDRLQQLAQRQNLVTPKSDQVFHLDGNRPDGSVAMVK